MTVARGTTLAPFTSLRVGGQADYFAQAATLQDLAAGLAWAREHGVPVRLVGGGSNLLVADSGVEGLIIRCTLSSWSVDDNGLAVTADAGTNLANLARHLAKRGHGGLEWAANVPGTVGGAVVNNAGAFGDDTASCVLSVSLVDSDGRTLSLGRQDLGYGYRSSVLKRRELGDVAVVSVRFRLQRRTPREADGLVKQFNSQRMRTQPRMASAGSVFANPDGTYSGKLIEEAGLKGLQVGGARISEQHANFIVNPAGATARDVYNLVRRTQDIVYGRTGIWLRPEIELLGRWSADERAALTGPTSRPDGGPAAAAEVVRA